MGARFELFSENERIGYVLRDADGRVVARETGFADEAAARDAIAALQRAVSAASPPASSGADPMKRRETVSRLAAEGGAVARRQGARAVDHGALLYDEDGLPK